MPYGHKYGAFPSPSRIKKLKRLAESELAPRYSTELAAEAERLAATLDEANLIVNRIAELMRKDGTPATWSTIDHHFSHLKSLEK